MSYKDLKKQQVNTTLTCWEQGIGDILSVNLFKTDMHGDDMVCITVYPESASKISTILTKKEAIEIAKSILKFYEEI